MSFFNSLDTSASGLSSQRIRMDILAQNIANVNTTRTAEGGPYMRRTVIFEAMQPQNSFGSVLAGAMGANMPTASGIGKGVRVREIVTDQTPGPFVFDPGHPDANADGYVEQPNVNMVMEMVNMISASRSYEANITAMNVTRAMINRTFEISTR